MFGHCFSAAKSCHMGPSNDIMSDCVITVRSIMSKYKVKTRKAAARRFRATGSGKIVRRKAFKSHLLKHKTPVRKRRLSKLALVDETEEHKVRKMMPYL
jgi:large subunit ribosomal protein L35